MRHEVALVAGLDILASLAVLGDLPAPLRVPAGLLVVLILPGYAVSRAVYPRETLSASEIALLSIGLSVVMSVLAGLVLNIAPGGMHTIPWIVLLVVVTCGSCALAGARAPMSQTVTSSEGPLLNDAWPRANVATIALFALASVLGGSALLISVDSAQQDYAAAQPMALWLRPLTSATGPIVRIGVDGGTNPHSGLLLTLRESGHVLKCAKVPELGSGASWWIEIPISKRRTGAELTADLTLDGMSIPLRHVVMGI